MFAQIPQEIRKFEPLRYRRNDSLDGLFFQSKADARQKAARAQADVARRLAISWKLRGNAVLPREKMP